MLDPVTLDNLGKAPWGPLDGVSAHPKVDEETGELRTGEGNFYTVFTPFRRAWYRVFDEDRDRGKPLDAPRKRRKSVSPRQKSRPENCVPKPVITSYSIHYTKLYEIARVLVRVQAVPDERGQPSARRPLARGPGPAPASGAHRPCARSAPARR